MSARWLVLLGAALAAHAALAACASVERRVEARRDEERVALAYVANGGNNHIQVIDLETGATLRRLYTGAGPWRLVGSTDGRRLYAQHWYAETTVVLSTDDHRVEQVLPLRGPGRLTPDGAEFVSFSWPGSALHRVDPSSWEALEVEVTDVGSVYDFAPAPDQRHLYLVRFDPFARGPAERFSYLVAYPLGNGGRPVSWPTGRSPVAVVAPPGPFLLTADADTNGLTLLNHLGAARSIATCPGPRALALARDEKRLAVACREPDGRPEGWVVTYRVDFDRRPWPRIERESELRVPGDLVALRFGPEDRIYALDQSRRELIELDLEGLRERRRFAVGDAPRDVEIIEVPPAARDRLASAPQRELVRRALARVQAESAGFSDLAWVEREHSHAPERERVTHIELKPPDALRVEAGGRVERIARGGDAMSFRADGTFWPAPRQELVSAVYALPALTLDQAERALAGDVPGSPYLRSGLAIDLAHEHREGGHRYVVVGADAPGRRVAQLWIDVDAARPALLVEKLPRFRRPTHSGAAGDELVETRFLDFERVVGGVRMPTRIERRGRGRVIEVNLDSFRLNRGLSDRRFDLARLGGAEGPVADPPTSGEHLEGLARWGVHDLPVPPELHLHNLRVGGVAVQYNCSSPCPELVDGLSRIVERSGWVVLAPNPRLDTRLALSAWGRLEKLQAFQADRIAGFIRAHARPTPPRAPSTAEAGLPHSQPSEDLS